MTLDRTGDPEPPEEHHCADGWLPGHTLDDDQPQPCLVCKPHLAPVRRRARIWGPDPSAHPTRQGR